MNKHWPAKFLLTAIAACLINGTHAQTNVGMATGNYAGISGLWMNPANAVDSRYKFDINIIGLSSYYSNNYLLVKNTALVRRLFYKSPYNSSFTDVKNDLLEEGVVNGKVYARTLNNIQFPLSMLITTGKKSAIAITMANRTVNSLDSLNPLTAKMFYDELRNPSLYNTQMNNDSLRYNFLNWQEVGFTYGRVLVGKGNFFLKAAVTAKWLGAGAAGYIRADKLSLSFRDSNTVSINSPSIEYGRTTSADIGQFARKNLFNNIEDHSIGFDAGIVLELRARLHRFKYLDEDRETLERRDLNKYIFRLGISVVDIGQFTFNRKPLTNDHSANIFDWDFSGVKASNFSTFDTAYANKVNYIAGSPSTFTYRLPAAAIVNFDLHFFGGFYVNIAAKRPLAGYADKTTTALVADRWTVITPRFESRFFGIYIPVSRMNNRTNVGATVKFGPLYVGSSNLSEILTNKKTYEAEFHAGLRLSILQGKPSKALLRISRLLEQEDAAIYDGKKNNAKQNNQRDSSNRPVVNIIIQNTDGTTQSNIVRNSNDSVVIKNSSKGAKYGEVKTSTATTDTTTEFLLRQLANNRVEIRQLQKQLNSQDNSKKEKTKTEKSQKEIKVNTTDIEKELAALKTQMALQNAALITTTAVVASKKKNEKAPVADTLKKDSSKAIVIEDSAIVTKINPAVERDTIIQKDTVIIRDTVIAEREVEVAGMPVFEPVYFETGKSSLDNESINRIKSLAAALSEHPGWKVELTGRTDASGTPAINRKVATARLNAVKQILLKEGIADTRVLTSVALSMMKEKKSSGQRRVDLLLLEK